MEETFAQNLNKFYKDYVLEQMEKDIIDFGISSDKFTIASKYFDNKETIGNKLCIDFNNITGVWHIFIQKNNQLISHKTFTTIGEFASELVSILCDDEKDCINLGQKILLSYQKSTIKFHNAYIECVPPKISNKR